jgi:hypothetical protein
MTDQPQSNIPPYREIDTAPLVYFDAVAAQGTINGAIQIVGWSHFDSTPRR